ncbi:MAG: MvaI/BcnI family restriction endonuclease [Dehalococcoidales bacterium]|nr:MvaI/BcnI family restriction endonuclease [Dehalococcoidales bacterium]
MAIRFLTKQQMLAKLRDLAQSGWIKSLRPLNTGGIGNTIDSLLGLPENNLPIADTAQWELKTHRKASSSLLTLFHMEPEPRNHKIVSDVFLPKYGWPDQIRPNEMSFRQTIQATRASDRGFGIRIDRISEKVTVYFDWNLVDPRHTVWLENVKTRAGLQSLNPEPYWLFKELFFKASTKLLNTFHVEAESKHAQDGEYFRIIGVHVLQGFDLDRFVGAIENGAVLVDFDARTHHNHGTKFRLRQEWVPKLYRYTDEVSFL